MEALELKLREAARDALLTGWPKRVSHGDGWANTKWRTGADPAAHEAFVEAMGMLGDLLEDRGSPEAAACRADWTETYRHHPEGVGLGWYRPLLWVVTLTVAVAPSRREPGAKVRPPVGSYNGPDWFAFAPPWTLRLKGLSPAGLVFTWMPAHTSDLEARKGKPPPWWGSDVSDRYPKGFAHCFEREGEPGALLTANTRRRMESTQAKRQREMAFEEVQDGGA